MNKRTKQVVLIGSAAGVLFVMLVMLMPGSLAFFAAQADGVLHAGTWEDDPDNWYRAFRKLPPAEVKVVHSKYWRSSHFTDEFIYFFEVEANPAWREAFLKDRGLTPIPPATARSFRANTHDDLTPPWYAPDPVELYEVWDQSGFGSVWINKTNGHLFFHDMQL